MALGNLALGILALGILAHWVFWNWVLWHGVLWYWVYCPDTVEDICSLNAGGGRWILPLRSDWFI